MPAWACDLAARGGYNARDGPLPLASIAAIAPTVGNTRSHVQDKIAHCACAAWGLPHIICYALVWIRLCILWKRTNDSAWHSLQNGQRGRRGLRRRGSRTLRGVWNATCHRVGVGGVGTPWRDLRAGMGRDRHRLALRQLIVVYILMLKIRRSLVLGTAGGACWAGVFCSASRRAPDVSRRGGTERDHWCRAPATGGVWNRWRSRRVWPVMLTSAGEARASEPVSFRSASMSEPRVRR